MTVETTLLRLEPIGIPPYSARGIKQTLEHIDQAAVMARTVNGTLINLAEPALQKYQSTISCTDMDHPVLDTVWPGVTVLTVDCIEELKYREATDGEAERPVVPGSERNENGYVYYRPRLTMMVTRFQIQRDEWGVVVGWTLQLEEV